MNVFSLIVRELIGMFIDDGFLAVAILAVVALAALFSFILAAPPWLTGAVLLIGTVGVLISSAMRGARPR